MLNEHEINERLQNLRLALLNDPMDADYRAQVQGLIVDFEELLESLHATELTSS